MQPDEVRAAGEGALSGTPPAKTTPQAQDHSGGVSLGVALASGLAVLLVLVAAVYFSLQSGTDRAPRPERTAQDVPRPVVDTLPRPVETVAPQSPQLPAAPAPPPVTTAQSPQLNPPPGSQAAGPSAASSSQATAAARPMAGQSAGLPRGEMVAVQGSRVRIRAEPSRRASVVGTVTKGTQLKVIGRTRSWVQVEIEAGKGWIGANQLRQSP